MYSHSHPHLVSIQDRDVALLEHATHGALAHSYTACQAYHQGRRGMVHRVALAGGQPAKVCTSQAPDLPTPWWTTPTLAPTQTPPLLHFRSWVLGFACLPCASSVLDPPRG